MRSRKSLELSDRMITNSMHAAMAMQTIFGTTDAIGFWLSKNYAVSAINAARVIAGLCFWSYGMLKKRHDIGFLGLLVCAWVGMAAQSAASGGLLSPYLFWVTIFGPIIVIVGSRKLGLSISVASVIWFFLLGWLGSNGYIHEEAAKPVVMMYSTIVCMVIFLAMCYVVSNYQQSVLVSLDKEFERSKSIEINKNRFLLQVNHELRNPISALLLSVDLLKESNKLDSLDQDDILRSIDITSNHILSIVNGVLDSEREENIHTKKSVSEFNPIEVAKESVAILSAKAASSGVTLKIESEIGIEGNRNGNKIHLRQVLINLISNSIQHGGSKTTVDVKSNCEELVYEIRDNGKGLSKQAVDHLFKPYTASMGAIGTTGLGLSICKNLVEITMGGDIKVSSDHTGTSFIVTVPFPICDKSTKTISLRKRMSLSDNPAYAALQGKSILVVEDDPFNNEMVSKLLEMANLRTISVTNSNEALSQVKVHGPFDFALVDNDLGYASPINGVDLTKLIAGKTRVIGYTGNYSSDLVKNWRSVGASNVILKPAQLDGILMALMQATAMPAG